MQTLAGLTIVLAVAHLSGSTAVLLLQALANREAQAGKRPTLHDVENMVPSSLPDQLRLLVKMTSETRPIDTFPFSLDENCVETKKLFRVMALRNRLIHPEEGLAMGTLAELGARLEFVDGGWILNILSPKLVNPWATVTMDDARFIVRAAESFFDELRCMDGGSDRLLVFLRLMR